MKRRKPSDRIAIIGAGPAGLSAAMYLKEAGYTSVVVFEKSDQIGGKCHSLAYRGSQYDMGANLTTPRYDLIRGLGQELGLHLREIAPRRVVNLSDETFPSLTDADYLTSMLLRGGVSYYVAARALTGIDTPGFKGLGAPVQQSFGAWLNAHGLERFREVFANVFIAYGYGLMDELPAAYAMKFFDRIHTFLAVDLILGRDIHATRDFAEGFQELWERLVVARGLDVRRASQVTEVRRDPRGVHLTWETEGQAHHADFDALILAMPLDKTPAFMDTSATEVRLFSQIETYTYYVTAAVLKGVPQTTTYVLPYSQRYEPGQPTAFYLPIPDDPNRVYLSYAYGGDGVSEADIHQNLQRALSHERFPGTVEAILTTQRWRYFPHVSAETMQAGFYEDLEALQGQWHTYYCGELLSFPLVELVVDYSRTLVEEHF